jgi:hypothetical protein
VVDRDLAIATTQFAPGAEVVKDKAIHTSVGVAAWEPAGGSVRLVADPLGAREDVALCRSCLYLSPGPAETSSCPVCGEVEPLFRQVDLAQPLGFRTNFRPRDFDGSFEWTARAATARISPEPGSLVHGQLRRSRFQFGRGHLYAINDNNGRDFRFARALGSGEGLFSADLADDGQRATDLGLPRLDMSTVQTVALGAVSVTDALLIGMSDLPPGVELDPRPVSRRGAWYSLGFLLREAAVRYLDVQSQELRVGLRVARAGFQALGEVFLADSLENGAGYCSHLGQPQHFDGMLGEARSFLRDRAEPAHADSCDSSCYDCLRDYYNMAYHPLLDWRLARDMLELMDGRELDVQPWAETEASLANAFAADFDGTSLELEGAVAAVDLGERLLVVAHPLEDQGEHLPERLAEAKADGEDRGFGDLAGRPILFTDSFNLLRRPGWVAAEAYRT